MPMVRSGGIFALDNARVQYLADGQTVTANYVVTVDDGSGAANSSSAQVVNLVISGRNDQPAVVAIDVDGFVSEDDSTTLSDSGSVMFEDADQTDVISASVALSDVVSSGPGIAADLQAALGSAVTLQQSGGANGTISWDFNLDDAVAQSLAEGQTVTTIYTITVTDQSGAANASATRDVVVLIAGANDQPTIMVVDVDGSVTEGDATILTDSGSMAFTEPDRADLVDSSVTLISTSAIGPAIPANLQSVLDAAVTLTQSGINDGTIIWEFAIDNSLVEHMTDGDSVTAVYQVELSDNSGTANATVTENVTIVIFGTNTDPAFTQVLSSSGSLDSSRSATTPVVLSGTFFDENADDLHTVTVDWGDGSVVETISVVQDVPTTQEGTFLGSHMYLESGIYDITVSIDDGNGGSDVGFANSFVAGVSVSDRTLLVVGTGGEDEIDIKQKKDGRIKIKAEFDDDSFDESLYLDESQFDRIVVYLGGDDDEAEVDTKKPAFIDGGAGDDELEGGDGRDFLIGGLGSDDIEAGGGQDLLISGSFEGAISDLSFIQSVWAGPGSYLDRVAALTGAGGLLHQSADLLPDDAEDDLEGDDALDLFFYELGRDDVDRRGQELAIDQDFGGVGNPDDPSTASLSGFVWEDADQDGLIDMNEMAIGDVTIALFDAGGELVAVTTTNDQGSYGFNDLPQGTYRLFQQQPAGFVDGEIVSQNGGQIGTNEISTIQLDATEVLTNFNFSETASDTTVVQSGQTATIGFWYGKAGEKLIRKLNGTKKSSELGDYLAINFPNMFGSFAGVANDKIESAYADLYKTRYIKSDDSDRTKLELEVLSLALSSYVTTESLVQINTKTSVNDDASLVAMVESYGFLVTAGGVSAATYDLSVWIDDPYSEQDIRSAFGLADTDSLVMSVTDILKATDRQSGSALTGSLYDSGGDGVSAVERILRDIANSVYTDINNTGSV